MGFVKEFIQFMKARRKLWLVPILIAFALFGGLVIFTQGSAIAPFIYTLF